MIGSRRASNEVVMLAGEPASRITITPIGGALGADVVGADLARLSADDVRLILEGIADHLVLRFRHSAPSDRDFQSLAERFGELRHSPGYTRSRQVYVIDAPAVTVVSNITEDGKPVGEHGDGELLWHTDLGFEPEPAGYSFLCAREVPEPGSGNTSFLNMYRAYEALTPVLQARIATLGCKHQASHSSYGAKRPGYRDIETDDPRELPGPTHPLLRTHPHSGRKALYLGRRFGAYIPGLPLAKSNALLDELWAAATKPENVWTQNWEVGDIVVWDNRCTMHRRDAFPGKGRRRLHRVMTRGEVPV
jgi:taurine dioxygenase